MTKTVIVAFDGSDNALKALDVASAIAAGGMVDLWLLHVMSSHDISTSFRDFIESEHINDPPEHIYVQHVQERILGPAKRRLDEAGVNEVRLAIESGEPAQAILKFAEDKAADYIVMGSRGLNDLGGLVFGSVSHKVSHLARCTCVTVH